MKKLVVVLLLSLLLSPPFTQSVGAQGEAPELKFPEWNAPAPAQIDFYENEIKKCKDYTDELSLAINKAEILVENVKHPVTGDPVDGEHKLEHQCPTLAKIPYINSLFLNKGIGKAKSECLILITPRNHHQRGGLTARVNSARKGKR